MHSPASSSSLPSPFTEVEERKILQLHATFGNNWAQIAAELPGRTDNEIMNFCNTKRRRLDGNQESSYSSSNQNVDISQAHGPDMPILELRNYNLISQEHSSFASSITAATTLLDQSIGLSGNTSINEAMNAELPETQQGSSWGTPACSSLPPFDETFDSYNQSAPPAEQTQLEPRSPRSNGYLEAIFYPPKVLEGSNDDSLHPCNTEGDDQGEPNSTKKEGLNQRDHTNQDDLPDSGWSWTETWCSKKD